MDGDSPAMVAKLITHFKEEHYVVAVSIAVVVVVVEGFVILTITEIGSPQLQLAPRRRNRPNQVTR
ncbi:hypothetical protein D3C85_1591660 [compost metagenome]